MAKKSRTKHAVLAWLANKPKSGYDIHQAMEASTANFWTESFGQLYPSLRRLEAEGFAHKSTEVSDGGQQRHIYEITDAGRAELDRWLREEPEPEPARSELLLKLFFGANVGPAACREHIERYCEHERELLDKYEAMEVSLAARVGNVKDWAYWRMTLRMGIIRCRANIVWAEETLAMLKDLAGNEQADAQRSA